MSFCVRVAIKSLADERWFLVGIEVVTRRYRAGELETLKGDVRDIYRVFKENGYSIKATVKTAVHTHMSFGQFSSWSLNLVKEMAFKAVFQHDRLGLMVAPHLRKNRYCRNNRDVDAFVGMSFAAMVRMISGTKSMAELMKLMQTITAARKSTPCFLS